MISVRHVELLEVFGEIVSENALMQSKVFLAPAAFPEARMNPSLPCETLAPGRLAPKTGRWRLILVRTASGQQLEPRRIASNFSIGKPPGWPAFSA